MMEKSLAREVVDVLLVTVGQDDELLADSAGESVDATHGGSRSIEDSAQRQYGRRYQEQKRYLESAIIKRINKRSMRTRMFKSE